MSADDASLSKKLVRASRKVHSVSDALVNAKLIALFGGDRRLYARAIGCFYLVFSELEECVDAAAAAESRMEPLRQASLPLYRAAAFEEDLRFYLGPAWREDVAANCRLPAVDRYRAHLRALVAASPLLLAAHAFTQNLAVASGGQILGRLVRRGLGLGEGEGGTAAFEYAGGPPKALKEAFKEAFDSLGEVLGQEEQNQLVEEHCKAFGFNNAIISGYRVGLLAPFTAAAKLALGPRGATAAAAAGAAGLVLLAAVFMARALRT